MGKANVIYAIDLLLDNEFFFRLKDFCRHLKVVNIGLLCGSSWPDCFSKTCNVFFLATASATAKNTS